MTALPQPGAGVDPVLQRLAQEIASYEAALDELPVTQAVTPAEIRAELSRYDFAGPIPLERLIGEVSQLLRRWSLHVNHPRYFGLFNPTVRRAGVVADALA